MQPGLLSRGATIGALLSQILLDKKCPRTPSRERRDGRAPRLRNWELSKMVMNEIKKERLDFLIELSRTSQEELMFRIEHRDRWLTHQLLAQAILIGLALGFKIGGVEAA